MARPLKRPQPGTFLFPESVQFEPGHLFEAQLFALDLRRMCPPLSPSDVMGFTIRTVLCDLVDRILPRNFEPEHLYRLIRVAIGFGILVDGPLSHAIGMIPIVSMPLDMEVERAVQWYWAWEKESGGVLMRALGKAARGDTLTPREHALRVLAHTLPSPFKEISSVISMVGKLNEQLGREPHCPLSSGERRKKYDAEKQRRTEADILEAISDESPFKLLFKAKDGITLGRRQMRDHLRRKAREERRHNGEQSLDAPIAIEKDGKPVTLLHTTPATPDLDPLHLADCARLAREAREAFEARVARARRPSADAYVLDNLVSLLTKTLEPSQLADQVGMDVSSINKALGGIREEFCADKRFQAWRYLLE